MAPSQAPTDPRGKPLQIIRQEAWAKGSGINAWIWQRVTAVALIVLLGGHMWVNHYAPVIFPGEEYITFLGVQQRLSQIPWLIFNTLLLATALFHGLNGVRNVIFDYGVSHRGKRAITVALVVLGLSFFAYGTVARINFNLLRDAREQAQALGGEALTEATTLTEQR